MGIGGSTEVVVNFNSPTLFYYGGDRVSGTIEVQNTYDKIRIGQLFLELTGELGYVSREVREVADGNQRSRSEQETRQNQVVFLNHHVPVIQAPNGQNEITLYRGQHSWPFEFILPESLPPSTVTTTTTYPFIRYYVKVLIDKSWYKTNNKNLYQLIIFPRVNITNILNAQQPVGFSQSNRKKLVVEGALLGGSALPGQKLGLYIHLKNPKRSEIKRVKTNFIQHRQIGPNQQNEIIFTMDLPGLTEYNGPEFERTYEIQMPFSMLAPTYTYFPSNSSQMLPITYQYELLIEVKSRGLFTDFTIKLPVVVGTEPDTEGEPLINSNYAISSPSAPPYEAEEPPPSYDSVVVNNKV